MEVLDGFSDSTTNYKVCHLENLIYGFKQALQVWFEKIKNLINNYGLFQTKANYSLYYLQDLEEGITLLIFCMDNFFFISLNFGKIS